MRFVAVDILTVSSFIVVVVGGDGLKGQRDTVRVIAILLKGCKRGTKFGRELSWLLGRRDGCHNEC